MSGIERFLDAGEESVDVLAPVKGFENEPLVSLEEAIRPVRSRVQDLEMMMWDAKQNSSNPADELSVDEAAAIRLYTTSSIGSHKSFYRQFNEALRSETRDNLKPWFPYLKLFLTALHRLPSVKSTVWRGIRGNVSNRYQTDCVWWGFSSCTYSKPVLEQLIGSLGTRTIFVIECTSGKSIQNYSVGKVENEILLMPGTCFRVVQKWSPEKGLIIIRLKETVGPHQLIAAHLGCSSSNTNTSSSTQSQKKSWLDCQYHQNDQQSIKMPHELENEMQDPPSDFDDNILNRIQGSMIGMALGDAVGAHVEFRPRQYLLEHPVTDLEGGGTWGLQKGQFTDDTSMALCLASSLVARRDFVLYDQLVRYKWWYKNGYMSSTGQCFDIGAATSQSLREFERRQKQFAQEHHIPLEELDFLTERRLMEKFNVFCSEEGVAGNGALMRLAPVPLFFYKHPIKAVEFSGISGLITHGDRKAYDACRYYGALIVAALRGETKEELLDGKFYSKHKEWFNWEPFVPEIMDISKGSYKKEGGYDEGIRGKGYIVNALEAALWAFWSDENSFEKGALAAVNLGDDTDTTAAIYGQLAGAYYGYKELPRDWVKQVYARNFMTCLSKWIAYEGQRWQLNDPSASNAALVSPSTQKSSFNTEEKSAAGKPPRPLQESTSKQKTDSSKQREKTRLTGRTPEYRHSTEMLVSGFSNDTKTTPKLRSDATTPSKRSTSTSAPGHGSKSSSQSKNNKSKPIPSKKP